MTPLEFAGFARATGLRRKSLRGMVYDPFRRDWRKSSDTAVNYLFAATKRDVTLEPQSPYDSDRLGRKTP